MYNKKHTLRQPSPSIFRLASLEEANKFERKERGLGSESVGLFFLSYLILLIVFCLTGCEKAEQTYSNNIARLTLISTNLIPHLNTSLNNPGEFCTITARNNTYVFHSPGLREDYVHERSELERKSNYVLGLAGLIVGTPIMADQLSSQATVVCFDLACPNCYEEAAITRNLTLMEGQRADCSRCERRYDLNTQGIVATGPSGRSLYRYRVNYYPSGYTLTINN